MSAEYIAKALGLRRTGSGWRGPCPVCGGSDGATKFTVRDDGDNVLVHCFGGCGQDSIVRELKSRSLWPESRLTPQQKKSRRRDKSRAEIEAALSHELIVLDMVVGQRVADRQLARGKHFRTSRPEWRPMPGEHWQREILAAKRIGKALEVLYGC